MVEAYIFWRRLYPPDILLHILCVERVWMGWLSEFDSSKRRDRPLIDKQAHRWGGSETVMWFSKIIK